MGLVHLSIHLPQKSTQQHQYNGKYMSLHVVDSIFKVKYVKKHTINQSHGSYDAGSHHSCRADPIMGSKKHIFTIFFYHAKLIGFFPSIPDLRDLLHRQVLECFSQAPFSTDCGGERCLPQASFGSEAGNLIWFLFKADGNVFQKYLTIDKWDWFIP